MVEVVERDPPAGAEPLCWHLLTTLAVADAAAAADVVRLYRLRWRIEQTFRMLKTHGLQIEDTQTAEPHRLFNLRLWRLAQRFGSYSWLTPVMAVCGRPVTSLIPRRLPLPRCFAAKLEGATDRQRNPHPIGRWPG